MKGNYANTESNFPEVSFMLYNCRHNDILVVGDSSGETCIYEVKTYMLDRKQAIKTACQMAQANDIILIAGKGHETYQEIKGERFDFDDYKIVQEFLKQLEK